MISQLLRIGFLIKLISLVRANSRRLAFLLMGFGGIYYLNGQAVEYLKLTDQEQHLSTILIVKNIGYLVVGSLFVLWPLLFSVGPSGDAAETHNRSNNPADAGEVAGDGFDEIRSKEKIRSAAEIELDKIKK